MELLGQLQLSFVLFVSLSSLAGFRHWQALSALLCRCGDALKTNPPLFTAFIRVSVYWYAFYCFVYADCIHTLRKVQAVVLLLLLVVVVRGCCLLVMFLICRC